MFYIKESVDPQTLKVSIVAWARVRDGEPVVWGGPRADWWRKELETWTPPRLHGNSSLPQSERVTLNLDDPEEWALLPSLDWGTYGWTRAESEDPRENLVPTGANLVPPTRGA